MAIPAVPGSGASLRRYLFTNTQFIAMLLAQWLRVWRPSLNDTQVPVADVRFGLSLLEASHESQR
jgi:hypothetical protein